MRALEAAVLGVVHGPAELLPLSSSAHVALLGAEVDQALAVAFHAGTAAALLDLLRWRPRVLIPAGLVTAAAAAAAGEAAERRLGSPRAIAAGMAAGAVGLALADRRPASAPREPGWGDGVALGVAQAVALWPGVSRNGATLTAARLLGFDRRAANRLSYEVGVPTLIGAALVKARGARPRRADLAGAAAAFAATRCARPVMALVRDEQPLWPFAAYRAGVALALLGRSRR